MLSPWFSHVFIAWRRVLIFVRRAVLVRCVVFFPLVNVGKNFEKQYGMQLCLTRLCNGAYI